MQYEIILQNVLLRKRGYRQAGQPFDPNMSNISLEEMASVSYLEIEVKIILTDS